MNRISRIAVGKRAPRVTASRARRSPRRTSAMSEASPQIDRPRQPYSQVSAVVAVGDQLELNLLNGDEPFFAGRPKPHVDLVEGRGASLPSAPRSGVASGG